MQTTKDWEEILGSRYLVQKILGKKSGRRTLLAKDLNTEELVVIKILIFNSDFLWDDLKLFEREAQVLQTLNHPFIPRYLDYFELDLPNLKGFALVQNYIDAPSLEQIIQSGRTFSEAEIKQLARDLLEILIYLHNRQPAVIHRDLKPSNILLKNRSGNHVGEVYLVDFGSVQTVASQEGSTFTVVGTYGYMAPEQFGGRSVPQSDLYSLGATLIYLVTGTHPAELPQQDLKIQFADKINLNPVLIDWINYLIEPSLDRRLSSAKEALEQLENPRQKKIKNPIITQPFQSKISLKKDKKEINIIFPAKGLSPEMIVTIPFSIAWNSFLVNWYGIAVNTWNSGGWFMALFAIGHLSVGLGLIGNIFNTIFGKTKLLINEEKISFTRDLLFFSYPLTQPSPRQKIDRIEVIYSLINTNANGEIIGLKNQINLSAGVRKYELFKNISLTKSELKWLSYELSDYLKLPIDEIDLNPQ